MFFTLSLPNFQLHTFTLYSATLQTTPLLRTEYTHTYLTFIKLLSSLFCPYSSLARSQVTFEGAISSKSLMTVWTFKRFFTYYNRKKLY